MEVPMLLNANLDFHEKWEMNPSEDSLKSRSKIYHLKRAIGEERVNDYNPLLLYLWKANLDIQYVADSTLALAYYVTGYITKAEKSHMIVGRHQ